MAVDPNVAFINTNNVAFPDNESVNASGPTATDGTEFVKTMIDNYMFGPQQALLNYAGIIPSGSVEADGDSQELEAMKANFSFPGEAVNWYGVVDPATLGLRILLLHGQGVLTANYPELTSAVYVGDGNNATAPAFYKADDAGGTIRNIAGAYLILPEARKVYPQFRPASLYTARVANSGVASITSQSEAADPAIASVNRTGTGIVDVTFTSSFFSVIPRGEASQDEASANAALQTEVYNISTSGCTIRTLNSAGGTVDRAFSMGFHRQEADYNPFGDNFIEPGIRY